MKWMRHKRMSCLKQVDTSSRLISNNVKSSIKWWRFYQNLRKVISIASKEITLSFAGNQEDEDTQLQKLIDYFSSFLWCIEQDGWWEVFLQVQRKYDRSSVTLHIFHVQHWKLVCNIQFSFHFKSYFKLEILLHNYSINVENLGTKPLFEMLSLQFSWLPTVMSQRLGEDERGVEFSTEIFIIRESC